MKNLRLSPSYTRSKAALLPELWSTQAKKEKINEGGYRALCMLISACALPDCERSRSGRHADRDALKKVFDKGMEGA